MDVRQGEASAGCGHPTGLQPREVNPGRASYRGGVMKEPEPGRVPVDSKFASFGVEGARARLKDIEQKRMQDLMHTRVYRKKRYLMAMRTVESNHAQVIFILPDCDAGHRATAIPRNGNMSRKKQIQ